MKTLYATDASAYREMPLGVAIPETKEDLEKIIRVCGPAIDSTDSKNGGYFLSWSGSREGAGSRCFEVF